MIIRPRRLTPPSAPGSLLKDLKPKPKVVRPERDNDPEYLALVRACPCLACGVEPCEAAHVRYASAHHGKASGLGKKPSDRFAVPLCASDHRLNKHAQHNQGERAFWIAQDIDPLVVADHLYAVRGDLPAMRAVCFHFIMQRGKPT